MWDAVSWQVAWRDSWLNDVTEWELLQQKSNKSIRISLLLEPATLPMLVTTTSCKKARDTVTYKAENGISQTSSLRGRRKKGRGGPYILLLIARKLTFEYDQMRVTSKIPKNYKQKQKKTIYII